MIVAIPLEFQRLRRSRSLSRHRRASAHRAAAALACSVWLACVWDWMNREYNLRPRHSVDPHPTPGSIQRAPAPSPMVRAPLVEPAKDMSAFLNNRSDDGLSGVSHSSEEPPAPHTRPTEGGHALVGMLCRESVAI